MPENWWESSRKVEDSGDEWWKSSREEAPNFPGQNASFSQGKPQAWHEGAWEYVRNSIFGGHPNVTPQERAEAEATGVGLTPTPAQMIQTGLAGAAFFGGPAAAGAALRGVPGVVGRVGGWVARNPGKAAALGGALPGALEGDPIEAAKGAVMAGAAGKVGDVFAGRGKAALQKARELVAAGRSAEARAILEAERAAAAGAASAAPVPKPAIKPEAPKPPAPKPEAPKPDPGRAAASAHKDLMAFAKDVAKGNPKAGEKIWMLLDDAGKPVRVLTPDQAGAAARKGQRTTWVKNLWQ